MFLQLLRTGLSLKQLGPTRKMHPERGCQLKRNTPPRKLAMQLRAFRGDGNTPRDLPKSRLLRNMSFAQAVLKSSKMPQEEQFWVLEYRDNEGLAESKPKPLFHLLVIFAAPICATPTRSKESCDSRHFCTEVGCHLGSLAVAVLSRQQDVMHP